MRSAPYEWLIGHGTCARHIGAVCFLRSADVSVRPDARVATLITVLSVMNGFERELRSRILSVTRMRRSAYRRLPDRLARRAAVGLKQPGVQQRSLHRAAIDARHGSACWRNRAVCYRTRSAATGLGQAQGRQARRPRGSQYHIILGSAWPELHAKVGGRSF